MSGEDLFISLSKQRRTANDLSVNLCRMFLERIIMCEVPNLNVRFQPALIPNREITVNSQGNPTYYNKLLGSRDCIIYGEFEHSDQIFPFYFMRASSLSRLVRKSRHEKGLVPNLDRQMFLPSTSNIDLPQSDDTVHIVISTHVRWRCCHC